MRLESNIKSVIGQLEHLKARLPSAARSALAPVHWFEAARQLAQSVLLSVATPQQRQFIPGFIDNISVVFQPGTGLSLSMKAPPSEAKELINLSSAQAARAVSSSRDLAMGLFDKPVREFEQLIQQWVETPESQGGKDKDARDYGKSDEEVASLISHIMLSPDMRRGSKMEKARKALLPHIAAWIASQQPDQLDPATVDLWLRSVLAAWRELIVLNYPTMLRDALHRQ